MAREKYFDTYPYLAVFGGTTGEQQSSQESEAGVTQIVALRHDIKLQ